MTEPTTTIRERLEAQNAIYVNHRISALEALQQMHEHAVAMRALLDNSKIIADVEGIKRLVLEPDPASRRHGPGQICECGHTLGCNCGKCRLCVRPDPAPPTRADMLHDFTDMNRHAGTGICKCPEPWPICKGTNKRPHEDAS